MQLKAVQAKGSEFEKENALLKAQKRLDGK